MNLKNYVNSPSPIRREIHSFLKNKEPVVILDIGACEGEDSIRYKHMLPNATVFSFEPLPSNIEKMKRNFEIFGLQSDIEIVPFAISDEEGMADFFVSSGTPKDQVNNEDWDYGNKSSSLLPPETIAKKHYSWLTFNEKIIVRTKRLDNFFIEKQLNKVDLIHMDVQGAELLVLKSAGVRLRKVNLVWLEVSNEKLYKDQPLKKEIEQYMKSFGFLKLKDTALYLDGDQCYVNAQMVNFFKLSVYRAESLLRTIAKSILKKIGFKKIVV